MIHTPVCDLLGIDAPIVCAPFGPWAEVDLAAAVCRAGALGSLGTAVRSVPELEAQWRRLLAADPDSVDPAAVVPRVVAAILAGAGDEYVPFAGQSVGLIDSVEPAAAIIERTVAEAEAALARAGGFVRVAA